MISTIKIKQGLFFLAVSASLVLFNACEKDVEIPEEEEEFNGDVRDRFVGDWTVTETSKNLGTRNYSVSMAKDSSFPARVNMDGFYMLPDSEVVIANVSSVEINTITIPGQTLPSAYVSGVGTMEDEVKITFTYTVDDGNDVDSVSAVFVR